MDITIENANESEVAKIMDIAQPAQPTQPAPSETVLTKRELEIFSLLLEGYTNKQISNKLFLSIRTIESHIAHIKKKTYSHRIIDLFKYAREHNLF